MLSVENKVKSSTVVGSVKKQRLFNMDVNFVGKRSSENELEADVEQPDFRNICRKAKVTKYLRFIGGYDAITDDHLVKEFREQCSQHSNRTIKKSCYVRSKDATLVFYH